MQKTQRTVRNVLGTELRPCSTNPMTGFLRDGCCNTTDEDLGAHTVCCEMTAEFLAFSRAAGNDLSTPHPQFGFPGLKPGDRLMVASFDGDYAVEQGFTEYSAVIVQTIDRLERQKPDGTRYEQTERQLLRSIAAADLAPAAL